MVCPYCNTRNIPTATICSQCGAILRDSVTIRAKAQKRTPYTPPRQSIVGRVVALVGAAIAGSALGFFLGRTAFENQKDIQYACAGGGALVGALIVYFVTFGRVAILRFVYTQNRNKAQNKIKTLLADTQKRLEEVIEEASETSKTSNDAKMADGKMAEGSKGVAVLKPVDAQVRYDLGTVYLLKDDLEDSLQQFEQGLLIQSPRRAEDLNNQAVAFARRGQINPAQDQLEKALALNPKSAQARYNLARLLNQTGREEEAKRAEEKLREVGSLLDQHPYLYNQLGIALIGAGKPREAISAFQKAAERARKDQERDAQANLRNNNAIAYAAEGKRGDALNEFQALVKSEPENARAMANLGVVNITQGKIIDAIERLQASIQIEPQLAAAHSDLGYAFCQSGAINEGIREFREAALQDPNLFEAQYNIGKAYLDEGLLDIAERNIQRALGLRRNSWHAHQAMGVVYYQSGLIERAINSFCEADRLSGGDPLALNSLAVCEARKGNLAEAEAYLRQALSKNPTNAEILTNLGWIAIMNEDLNEGSDITRDALNHDEKLAQAQNNLGLCQLTLGAPEVAIEHFKRVLTIDPSQTKVHYHIGGAHIAMKQQDNAIREWRMASEAEPGNADVYSNLGVAYYKRGDIDPAIEEFRKTLRVRQDRMEDFVNLGLSYARAKRHKEAIEQFDKALVLDPRNVVVHSNRGLACFFANNVEEAMREWQVVTQIDPAYAKRRGKKQQSEFDDENLNFIPVYVTERAFFCPPRTAAFLYRFLPGYETDRWEIAPLDDKLAVIPQLKAQSEKFDRQLRALKLTV